MTSARSPAWMLTLFVTSSILLASCGGSSNSSNTTTASSTITSLSSEPEAAVPDPAPIVISKSFDLGIREEIEVSFSEPMIPATLELEGLLADIAARPEWSNNNTTLTLRPVEGAWESGRHTISGTLESVAGTRFVLESEVEVRLIFETFQEASFVIGQTDFETWTWSPRPAINTLFDPYGMPTFTGGRLWIPDLGNNRMLGFDGVPSSNNPDATWVAGQPDFVSYGHGTSATEFWTPMMGLEHEGYFYMLEYGNNRVSIFDHAPPMQASSVIGQEDLNTKSSACSATGLRSPEAMLIVDNKLLIADSENNRVLIWNTVPKDVHGQPADLVLGQAVMDSCARNDDDQNGIAERQTSARTLHYPTGLWSDGERLVVSDAENNRVLIWNTFPTADFAPADVVLGQPDFNSNRSLYPPTSESLHYPHAIWSNGLQLFVADIENTRVLIWDELPTDNFQAADKVLGQPDFVTAEYPDDPSSQMFSMPGGLVAHRDKLIVLDSFFDRALIFEAQ